MTRPTPDCSQAEVSSYGQAMEFLAQEGFSFLRVDCDQKPPEQCAALIRKHAAAYVAGHRA